MKNHRHLWSWGALASLALLSAPARAGGFSVCDKDDGERGASEVACISAINKLGTNAVVADIFHSADGKRGDELTLFGKLVDPLGGCNTTNTICNGAYDASPTAPADKDAKTPKVVCVGGDEGSSRDFNVVSKYVNALDWQYANLARLHAGHGMDGTNPKCPDWGAQVGDGQSDGYVPWEGLAFDLGGPANKVVLFPVNDHGPQPCESVEYTVYLTDNINARETVENPTSTGADPQKWNRARLSTIYLEGWKKLRTGTDPDVNYTIEADSFSSVWSMPCGIAFRYVALIAGNDGKQAGLAECEFHSFDAEIDAVAGLTEEGNALCPDADKDGFADCECPSHPKVCDCNDADPKVHPGAREACTDVDLNCDGKAGSCADGLYCYNTICVPACERSGEFSTCPKGSSCIQSTDKALCVPANCDTTTCPPGSVCDPASKVCKPVCDNVVCPQGQVCQDGSCVDLCANVVCPNQQMCENGTCKPRCDCFEQNKGCDGTKLCNTAASPALCVAPKCLNVTCTAAQICNEDGTCADRCAGVKCPATQKCAEGQCVSSCLGVSCVGGQVCSLLTGACEVPRDGGVSSGGEGGIIVVGDVDGGSGNGTGAADASSGSGDGSTESSGCGCKSVSRGSVPAWGYLSLLAMAGLCASRRKRTSV